MAKNSKIFKTLTQFWQAMTMVKADGTAVDFVEEADLTSGSAKTQIVDSTGTIGDITGENAFITQDILIEVARGNVPGMKMFSIVGKKNSISSSVLDDITGIPSTTVRPNPGGIQLELVSSSNEDSGAGGVNPAGTGIRSIDIHYLDNAGAEQSETVVIDGTTPVNTLAENIDFVQWIHAKTAGSAGVAVGNISLRNTAGSVTYEYVKLGGNQSLSAAFKVPTGKKGYVLGWQASGITKIIDIRLRATVERYDRTLIAGVFLFQDILILSDDSSGWIPFDVPKQMPAGAIIKLSAISSAAGGDAAGQFDILLIDD